MPISSLSKITVPLASDQSATSQGLLMPKLQYRFRVEFNSFGVSSPSTELTKQVIDVARPSITFESMEIPIYNSKVYLAGKHTWAPISINLRDDASGEVQKLVGEQLQKQFDFMEQASAVSGVDYKFRTKIEILDGGNGNLVPNVLETWELLGCFVTEANYNQLAYATSEPVTITLNIQYDNAIQSPLGTGVGTEVGRSAGSLVTG